MIIALIVFIITNVITVSALSLSLRKNLKLIEQHDELNDQIDESLFAIDDCYARIKVASESDILSNEPIVVQLVNDIAIVRQNVELVSYKLSSFDTTDDISGEEIK